MQNKNSDLKEYTYRVNGMHCPSCELAIEKRLLELEGVEFADASVSKGEVFIRYSGNKPSLKELTKIFKEEGYNFCKLDSSKKSSAGSNGGGKGSEVACSNTPLFEVREGKLLVNKKEFTQYVYSFLAASIILFIYYVLQKTEVTSGFTVNDNSALGMFFVFGLVAGLSSCAALVGGLVLSMSKQWSQLYENKGFAGKLTPHILFNVGRLISFALLGAVLGGIGSVVGISLEFSAVLAIVVAVLMFILGLQMLEIPFFKDIRIGMPKSLSRWAMQKENIDNPLGPLMLGAVTFFLPCGFTITAQSVALMSGSAVRGALVTLFFALGTLPMLLGIGITSAKLSAKKHISGVFLKSAGILMLAFSLYTVNSQLNLLGLPSLSDLKTIRAASSDGDGQSAEGLPPLDNNGKQVIEMAASSSGYNPDYFKVRAGVPVKWVIKNDGVSGCTDAIISQDLFAGEVAIDQAEVIKEFTPEKPGRYKFSCWMGMVTGTIDVVDETGELSDEQIAVPSSFDDDSGGGGCGCSGGCGGDCGNAGCPYAK